MTNGRKILSAASSVVLCIAIMVFVITVSIGLPIYIRPFYYMHIDSLDLPESTGYTEAEIRDAFDEVMDYLTLPARDFGTGVLKYSESGMAHFVDCKLLFSLNFWGLVISGAVILLICIAKRKKVIALHSVGGYGIPFLSGSVLLALFASLGLYIGVDFASAFEAFHKLFFPGKSNWIFHPAEDEIITILPAEFFLNCAILICASILICSVGMIVSGVVRKRRSTLPRL